MDYVAQEQDILDPKGFQYCIIGSKVLAILPDGWIWPISGVASRSVFNQWGYPSSLDRNISLIGQKTEEKNLEEKKKKKEIILIVW